MFSRFGVALTFCLGIAWGTSAQAQVVRFETTVGEFDMVLNPTNNPFMTGHVDNMLKYIEAESYRGSWINRADDGAGDGFVLQMGGFFSHTRRPPPTMDSIRQVIPFDPVVGFPAAQFGNGLSNTLGTVSLALPSGSGGANQDAGTSSFFINLTNNNFLDADFTVFAAISDMTVVNKIMDLTKVDRTTDPQFGGGAGNLAFTDVPVEANGYQVFIKRAFVVEDAMTIAQAMAGIQPALQQSLDAGAANLPPLIPPTPSPSAPPSPDFFSTPVPEPASMLTAALGLLVALLAAHRRRRA